MSSVSVSAVQGVPIKSGTELEFVKASVNTYYWSGYSDWQRKIYYSTTPSIFGEVHPGFPEVWFSGFLPCRWRIRGWWVSQAWERPTCSSSWLACWIFTAGCRTRGDSGNFFLSRLSPPSPGVWLSDSGTCEFVRSWLVTGLRIGEEKNLDFVGWLFDGSYFRLAYSRCFRRPLWLFHWVGSCRGCSYFCWF